MVTWQRSSVADGDVVPGTTYIFGDKQMSHLDAAHRPVLRGPRLRQLEPDGVHQDRLPQPPGAPDRIVVAASEIDAAASFANPDLQEAFALLPDQTAPVFASDIDATIIAPTVVEVSWEPAEDNGEIFSYLVARDGVGLQLLESSQTTFLDETATPDATHVYTVTATDEAGNSTISEPVSVAMPPPDTTPPTAAVVVSAVATSPTTIELTWTPATDDVALASHLVARDGQWLDLLGPDDTTYTDTELEPDTIHAYTITATDTAGNVTVSEAVVVATPPPDTTPPTAAVIVSATATSPTTIELTWTPATDDIALASHLVARDGQWLDLLGPDDTTYTDTELEPGSLHAYTITATDTAGNVTVSEAVVVALPES